MFELEIATSTNFSFSRSSQHIFLGFSSQIRCQKRISAKWHPSPKKTFQKMKFLHLIATISRHTTIRLSFHWHQKCRCNQISAALFLVTYILFMIFPQIVCVVPDSKSVTNAEFEHRITNVVVSKEPCN